MQKEVSLNKVISAVSHANKALQDIQLHTLVPEITPLDKDEEQALLEKAFTCLEFARWQLIWVRNWDAKLDKEG